MTDESSEPDLDPIKASYDVFIKPSISEDRQVYILQFPNRDVKQPYLASHDTKPYAMRVKEKAGMVELDVPLNVWANFDRDKGVRWGEAIKKSNSAKNGGSHGLPGGFGIGGAAHSGRGRAKAEGEDTNVQNVLKNYDNAVMNNQVLQKQTLGGQFIADEDTTPRYMIGAFRKDQLHLTPVDHIVQMRPQFHHIDAVTEQERAARGRDTNAGAPTQARAIHMTVKSTIDGEDSTTDTMGERITAAQSEFWKTHKYVDEEENEAWVFYGENMFVGLSEDSETSENLKSRLPTLKTTLDNAEYMDTISAPTNPAKLSRSKEVKKGKGDGKDNDTAIDVDSDTDASTSDTESGA